MENSNFYQQLEAKIIKAYDEGVTIETAERLAGEFLYAQMRVSDELKNYDLDSRMRKSGLKAVRAAVYAEACKASEKKPTEGALDHLLNSSPLVSVEQDNLDAAEVTRDGLERYYNIFQNAHIFFRGIARGNFGG